MHLSEFSTLLFISSLVLIGHIDYQKNGPYQEKRDRATRVFLYMWNTPLKWLLIVEAMILIFSGGSPIQLKSLQLNGGTA